MFAVENDADFMEGKKEVVSALLSAESIVIASHEGPEPDAIGSSLALGLALESIGKKVYIYNKDGLESAKYLPGYSKLKTSLPDFLPDIFCVVDCATLDRIGDEGRKFAVRTTIVNIDHHDKSERFGTFNFIDHTAPACGVLIYEILKDMNIEITPDIATNIYAAIAKDTMGFLLPTVDARTLRIASELIEKKADLLAVMKTLRFATLRKYKLLSEFLSRVIVEDGVSFSFLFKSDYEKFGAKDEDSDEFIDLIRSIDGVKASIFIREKDNEFFKVSLRSDPHIDVGKIARKYGGGGHKNAAGFNIKIRKDEILNFIKKIKDEILEQERFLHEQNNYKR